MWSDRPSPERLRDLAAALRSVLEDDENRSSTSSVDSCFCVLGEKIFRRPRATVTYRGGRATVAGPRACIEVSACGFELLQAMLEAWQGFPDAVLAGFISYDLASEIEDLGPTPADNFDFPKLHFGLYDSVREDDVAQASANDVAQALACEQKALTSGPVNSHPDRACFEAAVQRTVARIYAGEIFQTNLCRCLEAPLEPGAEWGLFQRMRSISPARYEAFLRIDSRRSVLSVSPELFLKVDNVVVE